jgi:hypothetical protein
MVHFDKLASLDNLWDLVQKIDQHYWERKLELSRETPSVLKMDGKSEKNGKSNPQQDQKQNSNPNSNSNTTSSSKEKSKSKSNPSQPKKLDLLDKLRKDGKLLPQERQCHLNDDFCLLYGKVLNDGLL